MNKTKIDWCDSTWNPVTGCLHSCEYCYARGIANRFSGGKTLKYGVRTNLDEPIRIDGKISPYPYGFMPTFHRYRLNDYIDKKGRNIFVCSMADLFGEWVPDSWIEEVFATCEKAPQHNYLFLTKNPERYARIESEGWLPKENNMWYGATCTNRKQLKRAATEFSYMDSKYKTFFSIEPLLENITETLFWGVACEMRYMNWVIVGAESGRRKDKVLPDRTWIKSIINRCEDEAIPVFMKSSLADIWGEPLIQEFPRVKRSVIK